MSENCKPIKNTVRFFIHSDGYCFKISRGKEEIIPINLKRGVPRVRIENKLLNLVLLMIEYYGDNITENVKYSFKITNEKIPLKNILIKKISQDCTFDEISIFNYKCKEKASSQNSRVSFSSTITDIDVLNSLKRTGFKCFYCGNQLSAKRWHLDHVTPLAIGGLNSPTNITPSCKTCNMMKGSIPLEKFAFQIKKIFENMNNFIESEVNNG